MSNGRKLEGGHDPRAMALKSAEARRRNAELRRQAQSQAVARHRDFDLLLGAEL